MHRGSLCAVEIRKALLHPVTLVAALGTLALVPQAEAVMRSNEPPVVAAESRAAVTEAAAEARLAEPMHHAHMISSFPLPFSSVSYAAGSQPRTVTAADLNGDSYPELIVPTNNATTTRIFMGDANGIYSQAPVILNDNQFNGQKAAVADFNGDGLRDIAIVHYFDGVFVWYQNPDGSFGSGGVWNERLTVSGNFNRCLAAGDVDGDSTPDLVIVSETGALTIWHGPGAAGSWSFIGACSTGGNVSDWVELGDLNHDGHLDAVVTNDDPSNTVSVLLGTSVSPFFGFPSTYPVAQGPNTCTIADLNGDGNLDVAAASWFDDPVGGAMSVLLGHGAGSLQLTSINHADLIEGDPFAVAAGDVTGDGVIDVVVANGVMGTVSILKGNNSGTFVRQTPVGAGSAARGVALMDANQDGRLDIAVTNLNSNTMQVLLQTSRGFNGKDYRAGNQSTLDFNVDDRLVGPLAAGDLNADGNIDLATVHPTPGTVSILFGGGDGTFQAPTDLPVGSLPQAVVIADLDRDGLQDLAVANQGNANVSILYGKGGGAFKAKVNFGVGKGPVDLVTGDLNGDGRTDLVTANFEDNSISVLLKNAGGGGFKDRINSAVGAGPRGVACGDIDGDGKADLVVADNSAGGFTVLYGTGDGKFRPGVFYGTGGGPTSIALSDFNGDHLVDIAVSNTLSNTVEVWLGGLGGFFRQLIVSTPNEPRRISTGDLDGDGRDEIFVGARVGQTYVIYPYSSAPLGIGLWGFGSEGNSVVMVDANHDGARDLVTMNARNQAVSVLLNESGTSLLAAGRQTESTAASLARASISPNPLNPSGTLRFTTIGEGPIRVRLFDIHGRLVRTLMDEGRAAAGAHQVAVDGVDGRGDRLATGVYFYRIEAAGAVSSGRFTILK